MQMRFNRYGIRFGLLKLISLRGVLFYHFSVNFEVVIEKLSWLGFHNVVFCFL